MKRLLTFSDVAKYCQVTPRAVRIWAKNGVIPSIRISRKTTRFDPDAIEKHLASLKHEQGSKS
jgi:excisionase family DNA binding protein